MNEPRIAEESFASPEKLPLSIGPVSAAPPGRSGGRLQVFLLGAAACLAAVALYAIPIAKPLLVVDDFQLLAKSWTWEATRAHLWQPQNEHIMPLGRLFNRLLIAVVDRATLMAWATALVGPVALVAGMALLYLFVRRELGEPLYGLIAMGLFGVTSIYQQAVYWFAASMSVVALDFILLGLLAAQRWRQGGRPWHLGLSALFCLLAPGWFASGILAGPLCALYLLPWEGDEESPGARSTGWLWHKLLHVLQASVPLLSTLVVAGLLAALPRTVDYIRHLEHFEGKTAEQAFGPWRGLATTCRSVVDNLVGGIFGFSGVTCPVGWPLFLSLGGLGGLATVWLYLTPRRRLLLLGMGLIFLSYWLVYSARAEWNYDTNKMNTPVWGRYHLLPQLGLALFISGGLPVLGRSLQSDARGRLSAWQATAFAGLVILLFLVQLPRGLVGQWQFAAAPEVLTVESVSGWLKASWHARVEDVEQQQAVLRQIEVVDERCRAHRISRATAKEVFRLVDLEKGKPPQEAGWLEVPMCFGRENGWDFLHGSDDPLPLTVEEARRFLEE